MTLKLKIFFGIGVFLIVAVIVNNIFQRFSPSKIPTEEKNVVSTSISSSASTTNPEEINKIVEDNFTSAKADLKIGEKKTFGNITILPKKVKEDSRCPSDVVCIQAGRVRVGFAIVLDSGELDFELTENANYIYKNYKITLEKVLPYPTSKIKPNLEDFVITLNVEKI